MRKALYLSKEEAEALLLCICEADYVIDADRKIIVRCIEERLLTIADELTPTGYITHEETVE